MKNLSLEEPISVWDVGTYYSKIIAIFCDMEFMIYGKNNAIISFLHINANLSIEGIIEKKKYIKIYILRKELNVFT